MSVETSRLRPDGEDMGPLSGITVGPYQIEARIDGGGQSDIYRAFNTRLKSRVAVKAILESAAGDPRARRRFIQEARLTCQVVHPYVATVFDVLEHEGLPLLVMELVSGRTLAGLLAADPPPSRGQILRYSMEIAEALRNAHRLGVVHRDLKPANVMVSDAGHVKVMDFGLAKPVVSPEQTTETIALTGSNARVGTPLYMSPEQIDGRPVDPRSDLFSLGVVIYESLTGVHPFRRGNRAETWHAIQHEAPGALAGDGALDPEDPLYPLVHQMLEKKPAARVQTADEVFRELKRIHGLHDTPGTWKRWVAAAALVAVALFGYRLVSAPPTWDGPRVALAIAPFQDRTGTDDGAVQAELAAGLLARDLESSYLVRIVGPDQVAPLLAGLPPLATPEAVTDRLLGGRSVDYVVVGSLYRENDQYVAGLDLQPARDGVPWIAPVKATADDMPALANRLSWNLRRVLPEVSALTAWKDRRDDPGPITSESPEASLAYQRGLLAMRDGKYGEAIEKFELAIAKDPGFALAHGQLAEALREVGYGRRAREAADRALSLAPEGESRSARRTALTLKAIWSRAFDRTDEAVADAAKLAAAFPDEPELLLQHAEALQVAGQYENALVEFDRVLALDTLYAAGYVAKARTLYRLHRGDQALGVLDRAQNLYATVGSEVGLAEVGFVRGMVYVELEQFETAMKHFEQARSVLSSSGTGTQVAEILREAAGVDTTRGNVLAADEKLEAAATAAREDGNLGLMCKVQTTLGGNRYQKGRLVEAETAFREAIDLARQLDNDPLLLTPLSNLASLLAYASRYEEAREYGTRSVQLARTVGRTDLEDQAVRTLADCDYQLGDLERAIDAYLEQVRVDKADRTAARAHRRLSRIYTIRGELDQALRHVNRATDAYRELGMKADLAYALLHRAVVHAELGRLRSAQDDLDEELALTGGDQSGLEDLSAYRMLAEGRLQGYRGDWARAFRNASHVQRLALQPVTLISAHALACDAQLALGRVDQAVVTCKAAVQVGRAPRSHVAAARALAADALARNGAYSEAREVALEAFGDADRMRLSLPLARSAAVLAELPDSDAPGNQTELREAGRRALADYEAALPAEDRSVVADRDEIKMLKSVLMEPPRKVAA